VTSTADVAACDRRDVVDLGPDADASESKKRRPRKRPAPEPSMPSVGDAFRYAEGAKQFGMYFSNALAQVFANRLRADFPGILPDEAGEGVESRARAARGFKKLDVNYSTVELGMALGVSIKSITSRDPGSSRYTKNYSRNDNELRAEASDYHQRQPYSILAAVLFLPIDACDDAGPRESDESSFGAAVRFFRHRAPRPEPDDAIDLFEAMFVAVFDPTEEPGRDAWYYDVTRPRPPRNRRPEREEVLDLDQLVERVRNIYDARNNPPFEWAD
jgi:hypothetical protein